MSKPMVLAALLSLLLTPLALAVVPLTEAQKEQLQLAGDNPSLDDPGLYPLLENAMQWKGEELATALDANYAAIRSSPAEFRGVLLKVEGEYPSRARTAHNHAENADNPPVTVTRFAKPGPWEGRVQLWTLVVEKGKDANAHQVAVVYVVDPPKVGPGDHLRLPARFYKLWRDQNQHGQPMDYLVFVGKGAQKFTPALPPAQADKPSTSPLLATGIFVLLVLFFGSIALRKVLDRRSPNRMTLDRIRELNNKPPVEVDPTLPKDPIEALNELARRHDAAAPTQPATDDPAAAGQPAPEPPHLHRN